MDFFEIKNPIKKIGHNKYVIGQQAFDPLVSIDGKKLETYHIDVNSLNISGINILDYISTVSGNSQTGFDAFSGNFSKERLFLHEAFEEDEFGDVVPTNHENISDPMWILREDNNLELRANIWRYNTGPDAFTNDISF